MSEEWNAKAQWMRDRDALKASWSESGVLLSLELAPKLPEITPGPDTQHATPEEIAARELAERRRVALAAVGGLRRVPRDR